MKTTFFALRKRVVYALVITAMLSACVGRWGGYQPEGDSRCPRAARGAYRHSRSWENW